MATHSRWAGLGLAALASVAMAACAVPIRVNAYAERGANMSHYHTYDFAPAAPEPTGDPRLDNNPFFEARVRDAVIKGLTAKGYQRAASAAPDFMVHFHASVTQDIHVADLDQQRGYCGQDNCKPFVYDAGMLLMDVVDAGTKTLVWRGWAESTFDGIVDNQAWLDQRIDASVARITAQIPRAAGSGAGR